MKNIRRRNASNSRKDLEGEPKYLFITGHDYRSPRKANIHFIAAELVKTSEVKMFSTGFSMLSRIRGRDPRRGLHGVSGKIQTVGGVKCFLWETFVHPFNPHISFLYPISRFLFRLYGASTPRVLARWVRDSTTIFVEAGFGVLLIKNIRRWHPDVEIIYIASDDMHTIDCDPYLIKSLADAGNSIDGIRLPSKKLYAAMPPGPSIYYVPHGVDRDLVSRASVANPFGSGLNAVSVGSMLFDPEFFWAAVKLHPEITFHVIGAGVPRGKLPPSVIYYDEMPFENTLGFIAHADLGIAPYHAAKAPYYLCDTSMKLMQYGLFGLPSVCPDFAVGKHPNRFGYIPNDNSSIGSAISRALTANRETRTGMLSWDQVVARIINPHAFDDTTIKPYEGGNVGLYSQV